MSRSPINKRAEGEARGVSPKQAEREKGGSELEPLFLDIAARYRAILEEDAQKTDLKKLAAGRRAMLRNLLKDRASEKYVENQET